MRKLALPLLLSFNGGFVDTAGFLALQGLFTAHVTGNFVTLGAALVFGGHGIVAKLIALPEFMLVVAIARLLGNGLRRKGLADLTLLLGLEACFLLAFFVSAVRFGPFNDTDTPVALAVGFTGIAGMAIQNAVQRVHLSLVPPTTVMTGNTTQAVMDAIDLWRGEPGSDLAAVKSRFIRIARGIVVFAAGCGAAAGLYFWIGLWCLSLPAIVGVFAALASTSQKGAREGIT